jgi:hypothetical protein
MTRLLFALALALLALAVPAAATDPSCLCYPNPPEDTTGCSPGIYKNPRQALSVWPRQISYSIPGASYTETWTPPACCSSGCAECFTNLPYVWNDLLFPELSAADAQALTGIGAGVTLHDLVDDSNNQWTFHAAAAVLTAGGLDGVGDPADGNFINSAFTVAEGACARAGICRARVRACASMRLNQPCC